MGTLCFHEVVNLQVAFLTSISFPKKENGLSLKGFMTKGN
jgi:hypothetical protein